MKIIDFKEFGSKESFYTPVWSCLVNPDEGLKKYYDSVLNTPYNRKRFRRPGVFRNIGSATKAIDFSQFSGIRCLDMPIKMAGEKDYKIPNEFLQFSDVISQMVAFENAHNKHSVDFYAYLTVDQSEDRKDYHREPGLHVDGYQGARISPKFWCDRSYIISDCDTPSFWNQGFETVEYMDDSTTNIFHEFDRTKHYSSEIRTLPYKIYMMDSYAVHSANKARHYRRTFVRLSFSVREFDRLGNSHNNCFDYKWQMFDRDISSSLT